MTRGAMLLAGAAFLALAVPAAAQRTSVALAAGSFDFDLSGTGRAPVVALRLDRAVHPDLRLEGAVSVARPEQQFGATTTFVAPEAQLQWAPVAIGLGSEALLLHPYLGLGAGWAHDFRPDLEDRDDVTFSGALGFRLPVGPAGRSGLEAEFRARFLDTGFTGSSGDLTLGWYWAM